MEKKLNHIDVQLNETALDTELHHNIWLKVLPILGSLATDFIWPIMLRSVAGLREKQPKLQTLFNDLNKLVAFKFGLYSRTKKQFVSTSTS